jgi:hypothetical protein
LRASDYSVSLGANSPRHRRLMRIIIASLSGFWPIIVGLLQHGA